MHKKQGSKGRCGVEELKNRANNQIEQSYSERQLFEQAYDRFLREVMAGLSIHEENAIKKVDKVLGRDKLKKAPLAI